MNHTEILDIIKDKIIEDHKYLCYGLGEYVRITCDARDPSHGYEHMKQVAKNSLIIFNNMFEKIKLSNMSKDKFISLLLSVSWLHDVADRKYDYDGTLKQQLEIFVESMFGRDTTLILDIIIRTSYSFEISMIEEKGKLDWLEKLGIDGVLLRNIVSDADKLEAIGYQGVVRCMTYNLELLKKNSNIKPNFEELIVPVKIHAQKKLLKLCDNFIRTDTGKLLAKPLQEEMIYLLSNDDELKKIYNKILT